MSADSETSDGRMEKTDVRIPETLLDRIDEEWERRGYSSKSEAIRNALRDWLNPPAQLSEETLDDPEESREQAERGETVSADEAPGRLDLE